MGVCLNHPSGFAPFCTDVKFGDLNCYFSYFGFKYASQRNLNALSYYLPQFNYLRDSVQSLGDTREN